ncbi:MAG TPA: hypothetical protein PKE59_00265 [Novosphingobium sp.]|jgi:NlpC/P60 family putative phage cell wall peptidase|nr:hypothetical protein [Novosphingobium sp.]
MGIADPAAVVTAARGWLGTPYHDQASAKGAGCDCLGLARGVWREIVGGEPFSVPPYDRGWGEVGQREVLAGGARSCMIEVDPLGDLGAGTVVLFRMRENSIAKHIGILTGPDTFIHAYERLGVVEQELTTAWRRRIGFAFLYPASES